jgi:hypothetical protein
MLPIQSGVPIPELISTSIYPFKTMKVGDSFIVPIEKKASVNAVARRHQRAERGRFLLRTSADKKSVIVWRVE